MKLNRDDRREEVAGITTMIMLIVIVAFIVYSIVINIA
jgi:hypothetical protein